MGKHRYLFVVQGEGRGHMTQAIALQHLLTAQGHEICAVMVGKSERREIPQFFYDKINAPIIPISSPNFVTDANNKSISLSKTILYNLKYFRRYWKNARKIHELVKKYQPDYIINFYEFLCGVYFLTYKPKNVKHICIGHQYLINHPDFSLPEDYSKREKFFYDLNTIITSFNAYKKLALSFRKMNDISEKKIFVVPPLLRKEVLETTPENEGHLLVYMVNAGYADEVIKWHKNYKDVVIHLFCDRKDIDDGTIFDETLTVHKLNDQKFLASMKTAKAYASTAGFESVCEAMYLGKPVMLIPPKGHFEQSCNALDAQITGGGIVYDSFDISKLLEYLPKHKNEHSATFKEWVNKAAHSFSYHLTS